VADQFDMIEAGQNNRRRWIGIAALAVLLAVPVVSVLTSRDPEPAPPPPPAPTSRAPLTTITSAQNALHVKPVRRGGDEIIQVVFPHGLRAEVRYPAALRLADLGSCPSHGIWADGEGYPEYRPLTTPYHGDYEITRGEEPLRRLTGNVTLWPRPPGAGATGQVMLFEFGKWRLAMYDARRSLAFETRMAIAERLRATVTKDGYLVLSASGPVRMARPGEGRRSAPAGPQLWFGGVGSDTLGLIPAPDCSLPDVPASVASASPHSRAVCRGDILVAAAGSKEFVDTAVEKIRVRPR
jgi:hypothetical protein